MEVKYAEFEIFIVSITASLSLERANLSVHHFQFAGTDTMFIPVQDKRFPCHRHPMRLNEGIVATERCKRVFIEYELRVISASMWPLICSVTSRLKAVYKL